MKKLEESALAIEHVEKQFRTLIEKSLAGLYILQGDSFLYVNPRFVEIFGYTYEELQRKNPLFLIKEELRDDMNEKIISRISGDLSNEPYETTGVKKDGSEKLLEIHGNRIIYEGKPAIIGTVLDVTEKRLLEQEIMKQKVEEQKRITRAVLKGRDKERNKIGQELHDNVNQILVVTKFFLGRAKKITDDNENNIEKSIELIDSVIEEIRVLSHEYISLPKEIALESMLQNLIGILQINTTISINLVYEGKEESLNDNNLKLNIYRIVQEQLNNIVKHAMANNVAIKVTIGAENIVLSVIDNGKGFDLKAKRKGTGISNIINRVEAFNGVVKIESSLGKGCSMKVTLPIN